MLATQVPRVLGGCSYLAFDGGKFEIGFFGSRREWEGNERLCKVKKKDPGNYRQDSLTLISGKLMQQIILETSSNKHEKQ